MIIKNNYYLIYKVRILKAIKKLLKRNKINKL